MDAGRVPPDRSRESTSNEEGSPLQEHLRPSSIGLKVAIAVFALTASIAVVYGWLQHNSARQWAADRAELQTSLSQAKTREDALTAKVDALTAAQAQVEAARAQAEEAKKEQFLPRNRGASPRATHRRAASRASVEDPRWKQLQIQLSDQQKALADNRQQITETQAGLEQAKSEMNRNIQSARTELGTGIARNHTELVALQRKGERNYYEFSIDKSKIYHHTGPISLQLRKADTKRQYCDLQMLVDDKEISRKHISLYESVNLYPEGYPMPLEVVINRINKNQVQGYVSVPKYQSTEQATTPNPVPAPTAGTVTAPVPGTTAVQLEHRNAEAQ